MSEEQNKHMMGILVDLREWATKDEGPPKDQWENGYDAARNTVRLKIPDFKKKKQGSLKR